MTEEMKRFIEQMAKDEVLQKRLESCKSPEEAFTVAQSVVSEISFDDFHSTMSKLVEFIKKREDNELTDEDLEEVVGGFGFGFDGILEGVMTGLGITAGAAELVVIGILSSAL